jgi:hypothetical protein
MSLCVHSPEATSYQEAGVASPQKRVTATLMKTTPSREIVGFFWEKGSSGGDYSNYFRRAAGQVGLEVVKEVMLTPNPKGFADSLATMRDQGAQAIAYMGYGYSTFHFARAFKALDWDPPRFMGTAFMFYSNSNAWAEGLEGWHGVDELGEDGTNRTMTRWQTGSASGSGGCRGTWSSHSATTPRGPPCWASPTRPSRSRLRSRTAWSRSSGCRAPTAGQGAT